MKKSAHDRLFSGVFSTGIGYCDKSRERHGDYVRCGFLTFSNLELEIEKDCPADLRDLIIADAKAIQDRAGQQYQVSTSGQTITLGYALPEVAQLSA